MVLPAVQKLPGSQIKPPGSNRTEKRWSHSCFPALPGPRRARAHAGGIPSVPRGLALLRPQPRCPALWAPAVRCSASSSAKQNQLLKRPFSKQNSGCSSCPSNIGEYACILGVRERVRTLGMAVEVCGGVWPWCAGEGAGAAWSMGVQPSPPAPCPPAEHPMGHHEQEKGQAPPA